MKTTNPDTAALLALGQMASGLIAQQAGGASYTGVKRGLRELVARDPMDAVVATVLGGSYLFYIAEKGTNPKVNTFLDALVFITTCLSVGYADTFARTPGGKAIAAFVMTVGPKLSSSLFDPPASEKPEPTVTVSPEALEVQKAILAKLDTIAAHLATNPAPSPR